MPDFKVPLFSATVAQELTSRAENSKDYSNIYLSNSRRECREPLKPKAGQIILPKSGFILQYTQQ